MKIFSEIAYFHGYWDLLRTYDTLPDKTYNIYLGNTAQ